MNQIFVTIFKYADVGISATNRDKAQAKIWSMIDDDDIQVLVEIIIGGGKQSRIVATAVRGMEKAYKRMRLGLITFPRFIETYNFYKDHGGFVLPFGGTKES